jgi:hypothetical protein
MKELLINLLESFGYPVFLQGSLSEDEAYPQSFFTFWNNDSYDNNHYDNNPISYTWNFDVNFYSVDPELVNSMLLQAKTLLKQNGFIISGQGYDVASDEPTHTGRGMNALIVEN